MVHTMSKVRGTPCTHLLGDAAGVHQEQDPLPGSPLVGKDVPGPRGIPMGQAPSLPSPGSRCFYPAVLCLPGRSIRDFGAEGWGTAGEDTPGTTGSMAARSQGSV